MISLSTKAFLVCVLISCLPFVASAQSDFVQSQGARAAALGGAMSALQDDYAPLNNQAALAFDTTYSVAVSATRRFWLSELGENSLAVSIPLGNGALGIATSYNGFSDYNRVLAGVGYGLKLAERLGIGVQIDFLNQSIAEYGSESAFTFEAGVQAQIIPHLWLGAHVFNPMRTRSGYYDDQYYTNELSWGLMYQPSRNVLIVADLVNRNYDTFGFKAGVEYLPVQNVALRAGINNYEFTFGMGLVWRQLRFDIASGYHRFLGMSPTGSVVYAFGNR